MRVSVAPVLNVSGEVVGGVETFRDASREHHEVEQTRKIQTAMLQKQLIEDQRITFDTYYLPWGMVGGDYYATGRIDRDRLAFMLADVTGHGVAASMYTVYLNALWQSQFNLLPELPKFAEAMHREVSRFSNDGRFATALFGLIDLKQMCITLTFAGGPAPLLFRKDGTFEVLEGTGVPLGMPVDFGYDEHSLQVGPGDCLLAFTDGVLEISGMNGNFRGTEGLVQILKEVGYPESRDFKTVEEKLLKFSDRIHFNDDLTFLEIRVLDGVLP
jgi:sigma-B regulation protein RsbU (phosphoserine phosphatase)